MAPSTETAVRREIAIAARPETVWEFLVDPREGDVLDGPVRLVRPQARW
jgi:hypothetical protein